MFILIVFILFVFILIVLLVVILPVAAAAHALPSWRLDASCSHPVVAALA